MWLVCLRRVSKMWPGGRLSYSYSLLILLFAWAVRHCLLGSTISDGHLSKLLKRYAIIFHLSSIFVSLSFFLFFLDFSMVLFFALLTFTICVTLTG